MKKLFLIATIFIAAHAQAQDFKFKLEPYVSCDTVTNLTFRVIGVGDSVTVWYSFNDADDVSIKQGNANFPKAAIALLAADSIDITKLNKVLQPKGLKAIKQER